MIDAERYALIAILLLFTIAAAVFDWRSKRLPNALTVSMASAGLLFHACAGAISEGITGTVSGVTFSLYGFCVGFGLLFVLWAIGAGGGGDVKYTAALGSWLGASTTFYVIVVSLLIVIAASIVIMLYKFTVQRGGTSSKLRTDNHPGNAVSRTEQSSHDRPNRRLMPWAVPTAFATWLVLAYQTFWLTHS